MQTSDHFGYTPLARAERMGRDARMFTINVGASERLCNAVAGFTYERSFNQRDTQFAFDFAYAYMSGT